LKITPPLPLPSACRGRLYLLHREKNDLKRGIRKVDIAAVLAEGEGGSFGTN
jgi:hypothetical protein